MQVIVFVASKGGASKTTLLFNLATYAANLGRGVLIADLDPQASLKEMWNLRGELTNPRLVSKLNPTAIEHGIELITSAGYGKDFILIDTPGSTIPIIRSAVSAADLVVMPTRPNPVDLRAMEDVINVVEEQGKLAKSLLVLAQTENPALTKTAKEFLMPRASRPILLMPKHVEYARAAATGKAGWELSAKCKKEIKEIWESVLEALNEQKAKEQINVTRSRAVH
jgi:chromosome partitioning protein